MNTNTTGRNNVFNVTRFTKLLLDIAFVCAIITWLALPALIHFYGNYSSFLQDTSRSCGYYLPRQVHLQYL